MARLMDKKTHFNFWYFIAAFFLILFLQSLWIDSQRVESVPYSEFRSMLERGEIESVAVTDRHIRGTLRQPGPDDSREVVSVRVDRSLADELSKYGVQYTGKIESTLLRDILSWVIPMLIFFGIWMFLIRRMAGGGIGGGLMQIGKSKAKIYVEQNTKVTFEDVAGVDEAKAELEEIISFLKEPQRYGRLGGRIPKGVLLVGPPGTGKTLLARAVAGEAGVPFYSISGSEFVEMFVGVGAARVRDLFEQARQQAPAIIFIDELDALGRARGLFPGGGGGHDEKEQTLNQLLSELDGFDPSTGLILLAATNRPEVLDPALLRAGRFDRQVLVDRPDKKGRIDILNVHLRKVKLATGVDTESIAALTPGFTGADLANLVNEAALLATRRNKESITLDDFNDAIERIVAGLEKRNRLLNEFERRVVAHHEMGHALIALSLPGVDKVHKVSIIPRGIGSLGYTIQRPTEDRFLMTRDELENKMAVLLGGRAAEHVIFGHLSTGASDDLAKVTDIARNMVTRYGMIESLGHVTYERQYNQFLEQSGMGSMQPKEYSDETAHDIDTAVRTLVDEAFGKAISILKEKRDILEKGARLLLEKETLSADDLAELTGIRPQEYAPAGAASD